MTKEAGFLETIVKGTKTVSSTKATSNNSEVKTAPSLFDSMLNDAKTSQESTTQNETAVTPKQTSTTSSSNSAEQKAETISNEKSNVKNVKADDNAKNENNKTPSLLDKLVQEATKNIEKEATKNVQVDTKEAKTIAVESSTNEEIKKDSEGKNTDNEVTKDVNAKSSEQTSINAATKESVTQSNDKNSNTLLDSLLKEVNSQIKAESPVTSNVNQLATKEDVVTDTSKTAEDLLKANNEKVEVKLENTQSNGVVSLPEEAAAIVDEKNKNVLTQVVDDSKQTTSLLDKLVQDANTQIQKEDAKNSESVKVADVKNAIQVEVVKTEQIEITNKTIDDKTVVQAKEIITKETVTQDTKVVTVQTQKEQVAVPPSINVNEKAASELAKISNATNEKVALSQEQINNIKSQNESEQNAVKEAPKSLMDRLLDETKTTQESQENLKTQQQAATTAKMPSEPLLTNIYLSSLNKASKDALLEKTHEGKTVVANATSVADIKKGAEILNLGLQSTEVIAEEEQFKENVKNDFLNKLSVSRDIIKHDIIKMSEEIVQQSKMVKQDATATVVNNSVSPNNNLPVVEVNVSPTAAYNIENRIIGARQHMNSMMSDIARNMYVNYKPPVTAFRMQLNPGNLGSIAVLIKSDKESGLSISLNMSSVATLDSFVDNQSALRAALAKNFNANTNFNLEFNMQDGQQQGSANQQGKKQQQQNHRATNDILESLSSNNESTTKVTNYM